MDICNYILLNISARVPLPEFRCPSSASGARGPFRYALLRSRGLIYSSSILGHEASVITTLLKKA
ncbi:MAG: hypothetical protein ACOX79_01865 [Methanosarcina sp.]